MSTKQKAIIFTIFVCAFVYFCWYAYFVQIDNVNEHDLPLLRKQEDIKSKPEDPGGIEISNKDKAIYKQMLGKRAENNIKVVENQEKPVSKNNLEDLINRQLGSKKRKTLVVEQSQLQNGYKEVPVVTRNEVPKKSEEQSYQKPVEEKYSVRVAKLKDKRFLSKGVDIFYNKYPSFRHFKAEAVSKGGNYYMHFVNIPSKVEATKLCRELREDDRNCHIYKQ